MFLPYLYSVYESKDSKSEHKHCDHLILIHRGIVGLQMICYACCDQFLIKDSKSFVHHCFIHMCVQIITKHFILQIQRITITIYL